MVSEYENCSDLDKLLRPGKLRLKVSNRTFKSNYLSWIHFVICLLGCEVCGFYRHTFQDAKQSYGIEGVLHQWIGNFLTERSHCTRVNNVYSSFDYIRSGVVQGSCLGLLLFSIYINDIIDCGGVSITDSVDSVSCYTIG